MSAPDQRLRQRKSRHRTDLEAPAPADLRRRAAGAVREYRLWRRHVAMARIGSIPGNGINRQCLAQEDIRARAVLMSWAKARGYRVLVDDIANLFIRRNGHDSSAPPVMTGSHMDSQPAGGRFDGIYGVLAGLEALDDQGIQTNLPIEVVAWTNEEGGRFSPGAMGSAVFTGARMLEDCLRVTDLAGISFADALRDTLAATPDLERRRFNIALSAYVDAHIEQGPELEAKGLPIGVVNGIRGSRWFLVKVLGEGAHAGTSSLGSRKDALRSAVRIMSALEELVHDVDDRVRFIVGCFDVAPNSPNTVPEEVLFSIDFRHPDQAVLERKAMRIKEVCVRYAGPCKAEVAETFNWAPSAFSPKVVATLEQAAKDLGIGYQMMPSGAFHDANFLSEACPTAMLLVPCERGISHNPAENAKPKDLAAGARVLTAALAELAGAA
ncbi:MAG: M20 family metallo-hydrolase [Geminicoccaceae bacterium]